MKDTMVIIVLVAIVAAVLWYLVRAKKRGDTCIGCPYAKQCDKCSNGGCSINEQQD